LQGKPSLVGYPSCGFVRQTGMTSDDDDDPTMSDDTSDERPRFEPDPEWDPFLAGPVYSLLARDMAAEEEIDRVLAYLGLA
jgi:hypothetical protein